MSLRRCRGSLSDSSVRRWRPGCCSAGPRSKPSPRSSRSWCCNRSIAAACLSTTSPATSASTWTSAPGRPVNVVQVVVGPTGFVGAPEQAVVDYIRSTFADRPKPELIVTVAGPAAVFARKYRQELFPDTPLLFASVDQRYLRDAPLGENETAVAVANDFPGLVDDILQLLPQTRQVFMVMGSGQLGQFWRRELEEQFKRFHERLTFVWSNDLSLPEILRRCASLPRDSAILYITFGTDAQGGAYADERVLADLHATANAPVFASQSPMLGHGIVGGRLMSIDDLSRSAADVATRILNGAPPGSIDVPPHYRHVNRYSIGASYSGGASRRAGCRRAASCAIAVRACGKNTSAPCSAGGRAGRPIAADRRTPVPAPRPAAGRDRQPEEPGARR